jgi:hypothetical protein
MVVFSLQEEEAAGILIIAMPARRSFYTVFPMRIHQTTM